MKSELNSHYRGRGTSQTDKRLVVGTKRRAPRMCVSNPLPILGYKVQKIAETPVTKIQSLHLQVKMNLNLQQSKSEVADNTSLAGEMSESDESLSYVEDHPLAMGPDETPVSSIGDLSPAFNPMDLFKQYLTLQGP